MTDYSKITALYSRLSVGDEDRDGGESNSIQNQKIFLENYARGQHLTNIRHYIDDDESGRFFDRSAYSRMMEDVENGKIGVCIMKDLTRWGRDYLQVGNAMEIFRRNNVRFIAVNNGIDSEKPDTLEFAPFINIMSEWYAKDISKKVKTGIKTKGMSGKPIATEALYGYVNNRLMHIFGYLPLAPVYIVVPLVPEMLCSLEVDYIAAILLPREDMGQGGFVPLVTVILIERLVFTRSTSPVFHVESGGRNLLVF